MCHVPSWIKKGKYVLFLTDKDVKQHRIPIHDATGHSAVNDVFKPNGGTPGEGLNSRTPKVIRDAIESGQMDRMMGAGNVVISGGGKWSLPVAKLGDDLYIDRKAVVTMPNLKKILDGLYVQKGATLIAPLLSSVGGKIEINGKLVAPKLKVVA